MAYLNNKLKSLFLHNVKCGGSYIRKLLIEQYNFEGIFIEDHADADRNYDEPLENCKYLFLNQYNGIKNYDEYFIFTFVRNPYDKLYSAYSYLKKLFKEENYKKIKNLEENREYFKDFNTFIKNYKKVNVISFFHAFMRQYEHLSDLSETIRINYIGKLENIDSDFLNILSILGINEIKHDRELFLDVRINKQTNDNFNIAFEYNEESFNFVNEYFAKDFELFQYEKYSSLSELREQYDKRIAKKETDYSFNYENIIIKRQKEFIEYEGNSMNDLDFENQNSAVNIYKSIIKLKYGVSESVKFYQNINKIVRFLFMVNSENKQEEHIKNLEKQIDEIIETNNCIIEKNKKEITSLTEKAFLLIKNHNQKKHLCKKCNYSLFNITALNAHILSCKNKIKER